MRRVLKTLLCIFSLGLIFFSIYVFYYPDKQFKNSSIIIGILESFDSKKPRSEEEIQKSPNPRARILFFKENEDWWPMKNNFYTEEQLNQSTKYYPEKITWNVIDYSNYLGKISTTQHKPVYYSDVGIHKISDHSIKKFQLQSSSKLQFFNTAMKMNHKPLLIVSNPNDSQNHYDDPEKWHKSKITDGEARLIIKELRKKTFWYDFSTFKKHSYNDQDVQMIDCYRSNKNTLIVSTLIKNSSQSNEHDTYLADVPYWFYLSNNSVQFLEKGMMGPIEFSDIDRDGKTEWVFLYSDPDDDDQNTNGYILFYDDFKKSTRFTWHNH